MKAINRIHSAKSPIKKTYSRENVSFKSVEYPYPSRPEGKEISYKKKKERKKAKKET